MKPHANALPYKYQTQDNRAQTRFCYKLRPDAVKINFETHLAANLYETRLDAGKKILKMRLDVILYKRYLNAIKKHS